MLLTIDVGNTNIVLGLYRDQELAAIWRMSTTVDRTVDEVGIMLRQLLTLNEIDSSEITDAVIGSVVPGLNAILVEACQRYLGLNPLMVGPGVRTGVHIRYQNPREVGADRVANAVASHRIYGSPAIVIDFGTAVTYDAIDAHGDYLGGAIAPGVEVSLNALVEHTAKLHRVEAVAPEEVIGKTTVTAIQSGLIWGFVGQIEGMVRRMSREISPADAGACVRVIATGGQAALVHSLTNVIDVVDTELTLKGLRIIHEMNRES